MTDKEIIQMFAICKDPYNRCCKGCPFEKVSFNKDEPCYNLLENKVLDLLNRQQTEINMLKIDLKKFQEYEEYWYREAGRLAKKIMDMQVYIYDTVRFEVIDEFEKKLKEKEFPSPSEMGTDYAVTISDINNILTEMRVEE